MSVVSDRTTRLSKTVSDTKIEAPLAVALRGLISNGRVVRRTEYTTTING
jgi:hypothetical protein